MLSGRARLLSPLPAPPRPGVRAPRADAAKAAAWCGKILHDLKHKSPKRLFETLDDLLREPPSIPQEALLTIIVRHWNGELDSLWQTEAA